MRGPDSSWLAVPNLDLVPADMPVIHLVRDPLLVVQSMMRREFLGTGRHIANSYAQYVIRHRPDITTPRRPLDRVILHASRWDEPVAEYPNLMCLRIEDAGPEKVCDVVEFATGSRPRRNLAAAALTHIGTRSNSHLPSRRQINGEITWDAIRSRPHGDELIARAEKYGYL